MNPKRVEQEMSLHLDGRLPSGRREALLQHIADDAEAEQLWEEMLAAQRQARRLPRTELSAGFQDGLWQRISSGEGTPEAVFREPVPIATRLRYLAAGAAAAAAVIVAAQFLLRPEPESTPQPAQVAAAEPIATTAPAASLAGSHSSPLRPVQTGSAPGFISPVSPMTVARATQDGCVAGVRQLRGQMPQIEQRIGEVDAVVLARDLEPYLLQVSDSSALMRWMHREHIIHLEGDLQRALEATDQTLALMTEVAATNDRELLRYAINKIKALDPGQLQREFSVICCKDPYEFANRVQEQLLRNPRMVRTLQIEILPNSAGSLLNSGQAARSIQMPHVFGNPQFGPTLEMWIYQSSNESQRAAFEQLQRRQQAMREEMERLQRAQHQGR